MLDRIERQEINFFGRLLRMEEERYHKPFYERKVPGKK